ncbi:metal-dependent hydrolase [Spirosoma spitsbergense]|jgi:inner membrane protein|uniref:metal-dependent hydrolase n=1 Tax=Spirosoma spitsbergense TaxID=431554 RepID=UPI00036FB100|nr:metal-dependent hydrolase [Spirosoma spitsbergense]
MDSLTHAALGACIGKLMLSKPLGKNALLWGAIAQNLPDIDGVANVWLPVSESLLAHRGLTHSLPVALVAAAGLAWIAHRWQRSSGVSVWQWFVFFAVQLCLHDLLDTTNAYGTGLLEPFSHARFSVHLLYVIDPLFTLPLLVSTLVLIGYNRRYTWGRAWAIAGLCWALAYVGAASVSKAIASRGIRESLSAANLSGTHFFATPTPFNSLLWYVVATNEPGYAIGYRSAFEKPEHRTAFTFFPQQKSLLSGVYTSAEVARLIEFADGYYTVERDRLGLGINVLRFGQVGGWQQPTAPFTFRYQLGNEINNRLVVQRGRFEGWSQPVIAAYVSRIFGDNHVPPN